MIQVKEISKLFGKKVVVDKVSVDIQRGKITSFIGPNGAGKSTLLSMVSRLLDADTGDVLLDSSDVKKLKSNDFAKRVSILKQSNYMNVRLTIRELVSFGRFPYSRGRLNEEDVKMIDQAIEYMNLEEIQYDFLDELSGGQRQRAFIAMVIAQDTEYILLDEPLNNLDMKHSVQIMKILRKLVDDLGKTVVIVLHDINFASVYSDRIVALKDGRIVKDGPTNDIINSESLKEIYDMDIPIQEMNSCRICVYFNS
ncbi:ATP-binding cassette domain-containing protein [Viridibacillus sp. FSL R5-0477]|jgi:iron complex transport system ATP-binding protein|uniref:Ferrichrome ABC transporter ATP-binding protein n=2 Tax=Viridibacillus TaxID=496496 RepID=W4ESY7_9BACL|nr:MULTISPECIES: ATP-binding cassette domain-containing protein [Viridibacillus]ETT82916.1 ferrichrome ABC transporter ATP-binding protein [Viridibacillus arenosi FSL R5-213]KOO47344.1 iron ABC transporter ATP-binding protein [Viridibacillus arvi]OMC82137.1 iron ABC transporter ATP-binding protein [Viridibacillus sp. FSL H8-0123]OMC86294.1 iron ABC transporter ATP-binding protein [Viridibacillus sp. FSL H7-0596]OMC90802.1 iron ABC transporter ATP-binding protein [Viridibacillus arenosi]